MVAARGRAKDDPIQVALLVVDALEALEIPYLIGGSLASSAHGISRLTRDADLVADLKIHHAQPLADALKDAFYADVEMIKDAIRHRSCFNVIHLDSMFKVDVGRFKNRPFSCETLRSFWSLGFSLS
ncbi:MAG: hypothetical protein QME81_09290 [bacterium]|nr:hypothetical protein [bacterium]